MKGYAISALIGHPVKRLFPISFTDDGICIFIKDSQKEKASLSILFKEEGHSKDTSTRDEQLQKALFPIDITDAGIKIRVNDEHL